VLINSAAAIQTFDFNKSLADCVAEADEALKSGRAKKAFKRFIEIYS